MAKKTQKFLIFKDLCIFSQIFDGLRGLEQQTKRVNKERMCCPVGSFEEFIAFF